MSFQNIAKKLLNEVDLKENQLQQKENIIKEVREILQNEMYSDIAKNKVLEILDKEKE